MGVPFIVAALIVLVLIEWPEVDGKTSMGMVWYAGIRGRFFTVESSSIYKQLV
jgi:hypothetical protein